jgi:hypothetical protein
MKAILIGLAATALMAAPALATDAGKSDSKPQVSKPQVSKSQVGKPEVTAKARASYAAVPRRHHRHMHRGFVGGQNAHLREVDDPHSKGRPDRP